MSEYENLIYKLSESIKVTSSIENELFLKYNVKRGLRNEDHSGVLVGLTNIGDVVGYEKQEKGMIKPVEGNLFYRGINVKELVRGFQKEKRHGFEETIHLLLSGKLPSENELKTLTDYLAEHMPLTNKTKLSIIELKGTNIMNMLARSVMILYTKDEYADEVTRENLIKQSLSLIAKFPTIIAYSYQSMMHNYRGKTLSIRNPKPGLSIAENFLYMLKGSGKYTPLEADILDLALVLHAEHGGGNNSSFTIRLTSSSGTDTYSAVTAAIGSLKGPLHGGANLKVMSMFDHLKQVIKDWNDEDEIAAYLLKMLNKQAYNRTGKIYGIGHAVYTKSDPRTVLLKDMARDLAEEKGKTDEFEFLQNVERIGIKVFDENKGKKVNKVVCANVDFYSGFVYDCIGLPKEIYTPLFAMARISGWAAHRIEELNFDSKRIIRPAYKNVCERTPYTPMGERD